MAYEEQGFVKNLNGIKAPAGFHYMPNGKLMKDADHIAMFGYVEKSIYGVEINTADIKYTGETRDISIEGEDGAVFSIEIYDDATATNYYNFKTNTFSTTKSRLYKAYLDSNNYNVSVRFPAIGAGSLRKYTINVIAETAHNIKTLHSKYVESKFIDNSIDINGSKGSKSIVLTKQIYQDVKKNLYVSGIAPSLSKESTSGVNGTVSSSNRIVITSDATNPKIVQVGDKVTATGVPSIVHAIVEKINPDGDNVNEIEISVTDSIADEAAITFTPSFNGVLPGLAGTSGRQELEISSGETSTFDFTVTVTADAGRTLSVFRTPTTNDLCCFKSIDFGSLPLAIEGENTSSDTLFYRFPVDNIAGLREGMILDPSRALTGANVTYRSSISNYRTTISSTSIIEEKYSNQIENITLTDVYVPGVDAFGNDITSIDRTGAITAQAGNLVFNKQQSHLLKLDTSVKVYGYGSDGIASLTGTRLSIRNVKVTPTQISTTTTSGISSNQTIPVTEVGNIAYGQTVRGIGIDATAVNPIVLRKSALSGNGDIIVSTAQTLESGQTLFFDGSSNVLTITGTIDVEQMGISDTTVYFDYEKFIRAT